MLHLVTFTFSSLTSWVFFFSGDIKGIRIEDHRTKFCGGSGRLQGLGLEALSRIWEQCYCKEGGSRKHFDLCLTSDSPIVAVPAPVDDLWDNNEF